MRLSDKQMNVLGVAERGPIELNGFGFSQLRWSILSLTRRGLMKRSGRLFAITEAGRRALSDQQVKP